MFRRGRQGAIVGGGGKRAGELGRVYEDGEEIIRQGEIGNCMYVIQDGTVEVIREVDGKHLRVAELGAGEFFGEMSLFERIARSATVRAVGRARVRTIDTGALLGRIQEDPGLAIVKLCHLPLGDHSRAAERRPPLTACWRRSLAPSPCIWSPKVDLAKWFATSLRESRVCRS